MLSKNVNDMISKSLDEIDAIIDGIKSGETINKGMGGDVPPEEVSQEAPQEGEEGDVPPEEGTEGDVPPEEGQEGDVPPEEGTEEDNDEGIERSLSNDMNGKDSVRKALEVSEFLTELVNSMSTVIDGQKQDIAKSIKATEDNTVLLAKSFQGIAKAQKAVLEIQSGLAKSLNGITDAVNSISNRMSALEKQPVGRKAVSSTAQPIEKSFSKSLGEVTPKNDKLSKSQALDKLGVEFGKGNTALANDIILLESTGDFNSISATAKQLIGM